jgi:hypothetical protein
LGDLLRKYDSKRLSGRPKQDPDRARLAKLSETPIAMIRMSILQASDFIEYRDERCKMVKGSTVKKELEVFLCRDQLGSTRLAHKPAGQPSLSEILCARHNIPPKEFSCLAIQRQPLRAAKRPCRNSASKCSKSSFRVQ